MKEHFSHNLLDR